MYFLLCAIAVAYVVGSSPFSGLIQNALALAFPQMGNRTLALARVLADIAKGYVSVLSFCLIAGFESAQFGVLIAYLGHVYRFDPNFGGGNGMGLLLGALIVLHPVISLIALIAWLFTYYVFRYASLSALTAAFVTPFSAAFLQLGVETYILFAIAVMIFIRQKSGLYRLFVGEEQMVVWE